MFHSIADPYTLYSLPSGNPLVLNPTLKPGQSWKEIQAANQKAVEAHRLGPGPRETDLRRGQLVY